MGSGLALFGLAKFYCSHFQMSSVTLWLNVARIGCRMVGMSELGSVQVMASLCASNCCLRRHSNHTAIAFSVNTIQGHIKATGDKNIYF